MVASQGRTVKDVRITLLVTVTAIVGYAAMVMLSGCDLHKRARGDDVFHVTCYSAGQLLVDTESQGWVLIEDGTASFYERGTGKRWKVTGDCVVAEESGK
jgi:hypothetical protein